MTASLTSTSPVAYTDKSKPLIGFAALVGILSVLIVVLFVVSIGAGRVAISFQQIFSSLGTRDRDRKPGTGQGRRP